MNTRAHLQQVEEDVDDLVSTLQRLLSVCEGGEYQPERVEEAARSIARGALKDALEGYVERAEVALARLQAKEEGT
jgi:hypothetical protein